MSPWKNKLFSVGELCLHTDSWTLLHLERGTQATVSVFKVYRWKRNNVFHQNINFSHASIMLSDLSEEFSKIPVEVNTLDKSKFGSKK